MPKPPRERRGRAPTPTANRIARRPAPARALPPALRRILPVVAYLLPVILLGLAEMACRLGGYGGYPPAIVRVGEDGGHTWYSTHRRGSDVFFSVARPAPGGGMREIQFESPEPAGAVRIAFLGESAMQGFPQPLPLTNGAFLASMLRDAWGGQRHVEVLNFGATAVASFPVRHFLDEVLETAQPDLVVLMVGNNEFYGAYGMESLPRIAWSPAGMRCVHALRSLGLSQWLAARFASKTPSGALMERAAAGRQIGPEDPQRRAAARSLTAHLSTMVRHCVARHVPVIVCTVPTNERGLAPVGVDREPQSPEARTALRDALARAESLLAGDPAKAAELVGSAVATQPTHARAHFVLAQALTRLGRHAEALSEYVQARDLDTMPWRATSAAQQAARTAASEGAVLCDMEAAFRAASPGGAIGWELLDDHVHMTLRGQALFARVLAGTLATLPEPLRVSPESLAGLPDWEVYAERSGHSIYSDYYAASHMRKLFAIEFMRRNNEAVHARLEADATALLAQMSDVDRSAVARWNDPSLHGASERPLEFVVGVYRMGAGDYETAARLFRVARENVPLISLWRLELTWHLLTCDRHLRAAPAPEDMDLCREMIRSGELLGKYGGTDNPDVLRYLGLAYNMAGDFAAAIARLEPVVQSATGQDGWETVATLVDSYLQLGRRADARNLLERASRDPQMGGAASRMLNSLGASSPQR